MHSLLRPAAAVACAALLVVLAGCDASDPFANAASAAPFPGTGNPVACANRVNNTAEKLLDCMTLEGVRRHQAAFQSIADANGGTRADNTDGYRASVDYVVETLEAAGWDVERMPFQYSLIEGTLEQLTPTAAPYLTRAFTGTGFGDVTGSVTPVDIDLATPESSTSGCEASDFGGLDFSGPYDIALIQRGSCFFSVKVANAEAAGAEAVVIFNQGTAGRLELIFGTVSTFPDGSPSNPTVPVVGASFADGVALAQAGTTARAAAEFVTRTSENVVAESRTGDPSSVVMVGAHLDSVMEGPGINDNGSGSAAILETAVLMAKVRPRNRVRFAWWGAEEAGLIGSSAYVAGLAPAERDAIALYLNFDMIGSPNYVRFVYDSSPFGLPGLPGSVAAQSFFESFYADRGLASELVTISGRSDHAPFEDAGIATGGLFTGADGIKTPGQAALYGGIAGDQYDPCYHLACDTFDNVSLEVLDLNADAVAAATLHFAMDRSAGAVGTSAMATSAARRGPVPSLDHSHEEMVVE